MVFLNPTKFMQSVKILIFIIKFIHLTISIDRTALLANGYNAQSTELEHENLMRTVEECFKRVDVNGDGKLDFNEFKLAIESNTIMNQCFVAVPFQN
jgi:Ca2+-binding EF-hand superfamily protein